MNFQKIGRRRPARPAGPNGIVDQRDPDVVAGNIRNFHDYKSPLLLNVYTYALNDFLIVANPKIIDIVNLDYNQ
jgi:hypothetical protein